MDQDRRRFRPMEVGDILDEVFYLYRQNIALLASICAVLYVPFYIVVAILGASLGERVVVIGQYFRALFIDFAITGALVYAVSQLYLGHKITVADAYRFIGRRIWTFLATQILTTFAISSPLLVVMVPIGLFAGLAAFRGAFSDVGSTMASVGLIGMIAVGLMFAGVCAIMLAIRFMVVPAIFVIEGQWAFDALKRSWNLIAGFGLKAFVISFIAQLIIGTMLQLSQLVTWLIPEGAVQVVTSAVLIGLFSTFLVPITSLCYVVIYYDLRIRKEGFDLEILAQELEQRKQIEENLPA